MKLWGNSTSHMPRKIDAIAVANRIAALHARITELKHENFELHLKSRCPRSRQSAPAGSLSLTLLQPSPAPALAVPPDKPHLHAMIQRVTLPRPPMPIRQRSQIEAFLVLRRNLLELWGEAAYEEDILPGRFLGRTQLMLNDPEAIRHVLIANSANYQRNIGTKRVLQPLLGGGLFLAEGDAWRHQRRTIAPAMAPRTMPILARHVIAASELAEQALVAGPRVVELLPRLQRLALRIATQSMMSLEADSFAEPMRALLFRYGTRHAQPGLLDLLLPGSVQSPSDHARARFRAEWTQLIDGVITGREARPADPDQPRDLFDLLASARDPETGAGFDRALLRDEIATMIIAGHETTAVTLFWACFCAAKMKDEQEAIALEAASLDLSRDSAAAALPALVRTRAFLDEVLRLYPPAFLIVREAIESDTIAGHVIAPGTVISISPWVLQRHRRRWTTPDSFDSARFAPGATPPDRYSYMPFGAGPRICVGAQFAITEAVLVLARLLRRFRITLVGGELMVPRGIVTTQPDRPVRFLIQGRQGQTPASGATNPKTTAVRAAP